MNKEDEKLFGITWVKFCDNDQIELSPVQCKEFVYEDGSKLRVIIDGLWVKWALFESAGMVIGGEQFFDLLVYGDGPSGNLREARHTYFDEDGYVFHIRPKLLQWCFDKLTEWFDFKG